MSYHFRYSLTTQQENILRAFYSLNALLFLACFIFALYNLTRYIWRKRMKSCLTVCFYAATFLDMISHTCTMIYFASYPESRICSYCHEDSFGRKLVFMFYVLGSQC